MYNLDNKGIKTTFWNKVSDFIPIELHDMIRDRLDKLCIVNLHNEEFKQKYSEFNGKGFLPAAFEHRGIVFIKEDNVDIHILFHEILHALSESENNLWQKKGLLLMNKEKKFYYGNGFNEAFTEYFTSVILNDSFSGYSEDFNYIIQLFINISNFDAKDIAYLYFNDGEWLTDDIMNKFSNNESLANLVIEYDNRLTNGKRKFDHNNVIKILLDAINEGINNNNIKNINEIMKNLKNISNYFYDKDFIVSDELRYKESEILDKLGDYKSDIFYKS